MFGGIPNSICSDHSRIRVEFFEVDRVPGMRELLSISIYKKIRIPLIGLFYNKGTLPIFLKLGSRNSSSGKFSFNDQLTFLKSVF